MKVTPARAKALKSPWVPSTGLNTKPSLLAPMSYCRSLCSGPTLSEGSQQNLKVPSLFSKMMSFVGRYSGWAPAPVRSQLIGGHSNQRRAGSPLADGNLHALKLWCHFASQKKSRAADNFDEPPRTRLCREGEALLARSSQEVGP